MNKTALVIGGGPAGLMAADHLSAHGVQVIVVDAKPSFARKFLMAGKSGLNLTMNEPIETCLRRYDGCALDPIVSDFGPSKVMEWADALGADVFTGSSGRVFPKAMKASPLLRAWIARLIQHGADLRSKWRWIGVAGQTYSFDTPTGRQSIHATTVILATGGASWSRLGSDGAWTTLMPADAVKMFQASNSAADIRWSDHMNKFMGQPVKAIALTSGTAKSTGEIILSTKGIEGGGVYPLSKGIRETGKLTIDLCPDWTLEKVTKALARPAGKNSLANHIRKTLGLPAIKLALLRECSGLLPKNPTSLAQLIKSLPLTNIKLRPIDEAISTVGGVKWDALDAGLMIRARPGVFCAGEMIDWDAPTGGYLLTACLATGRWAAIHALARMKEPMRL